MADDKTGKLLDAIGHSLAQDADYPYEPTLLYAQVGSNMAGESIYKELADNVLFRWPLRSDLLYALLDLWESQEGNYRWVEIEYLLRDGKFEVTYVYPDQFDPEEDVDVRREDAVRRHFGEKPIVYPPWPEDDEWPEFTV